MQVQSGCRKLCVSPGKGPKHWWLVTSLPSRQPGGGRGAAAGGGQPREAHAWPRSCRGGAGCGDKLTWSGAREGSAGHRSRQLLTPLLLSASPLLTQSHLALFLAPLPPAWGHLLGSSGAAGWGAERELRALRGSWEGNRPHSEASGSWSQVHDQPFQSAQDRDCRCSSWRSLGKAGRAGSPAMHPASAELDCVRSGSEAL